MPQLVKCFQKHKGISLSISRINQKELALPVLNTDQGVYCQCKYKGIGFAKPREGDLILRSVVRSESKTCAGV